MRLFSLLIFLTTLASLAGVVSCLDAPIENTDPLNKEPIWESQLYLPDVSEVTTTPHNLEIMPIYDGILMTGFVNKENYTQYVGLDINTGEIKWLSDEETQPFQDHRATIRYQAQKENVAYFYTWDREYDEQNNPVDAVTPLYAYDVVTGDLIFRKV